MKQILTLLILSIALSLPLHADEHWEKFRNRVEPYYYTLSAQPVENASFLYTTSAYIDYVKTRYDSGYAYPLKLIWTRKGKVYYVLQPYPGQADSTSKRLLLAQIQLVSNQFKGFFLDWQSFYLYSPLADIPDTPKVVAGLDTIQVTYTSGGKGMEATVKKLFLPSGKLIQVTVLAGNSRVVNYPIFSEVEGKWLCTGWNSQIYRGGEVSSGIACRMELSKIGGYWLPTRIDMLIQSSAKPEDKYLSTIYMKDYQFNTPLQEIQKPQSGK